MKRRPFIKFLSTLPFVGVAQQLIAAIADVRNKPSVLPHFSRTSFSTPTVVLNVIGDWGAGGSLQRKVAKAMQSHAETSTREYPSKPNWIVSTGDNIYPDGVDSAHDKQWATKFESVYTGSLLQVDWFPVLGNHDYRKSPDAQVQYSSVNHRWKMPSRYWKAQLDVPDFGAVDGGNKSKGFEILVVGLDTQALLQRPDGWKKQLEWLESTLASASSSTWKIVVGHHPIRSYGHYGDQPWLLNTIKPLMEKYGVRVYLCGHDHDLQVIRNPADTFACVVSGNGGGKRDTVWGGNTRFAYSDGGFAVLVLSENTMEVQLIDANASVLYSEVIV